MAATAAASAPSRHHRRSSSATSTRFSNEHLGPGAFAPMPALPRRKPNLTPPTPPRAKPMFHLHNDSSGTDDDDDDDEQEERVQKPSSIHFPTTSPPPPQPTPLPYNRSPIVLANGKPLRPSLKSSSSSPHVPTTSTTHHTRAHSAPTSPLNSTDNIQPPQPVHKNVHFQDDTHLTSVRVFHKAGRPRSVSEDRAWDDTETETEGYESNTAASVPFPVVSLAPSTTPTVSVKLAPPPLSSVIPAMPPPSTATTARPDPPHVLLTSLTLHSSNGGSTLALHGSLLVLNIAYEKHVSVRFTLDHWATTCEVQASWAGAGVLPLAWTKAIRPVTSNVSQPSYDTFTFHVALSDLCLSRTLASRTLVLCARYAALSNEWWDNNHGKNYEIRFLEGPPPPSDSEKMPVRPGMPGRSYSAPVSAKWESKPVGGALPTVKAMREMNERENARKRADSGVGVKWGMASGWNKANALPSWTAPPSKESPPPKPKEIEVPETRVPLNLDEVSRGTGFSHFALPDLPASEGQQRAAPPSNVIPFPSLSSPPPSSESVPAAVSSPVTQTPPESPYLNTKLKLRNYVPPRSRSGSVAESSSPSQLVTPVEPKGEKKEPQVPKMTTTPPSPPALGKLAHPQQQHSPLPTPPASRNSSFTNAAAAGLPVTIPAALGLSEERKASGSPPPPTSPTTTDSYAALLAKWCFHTSSPSVHSPATSVSPSNSPPFTSSPKPMSPTASNNKISPPILSRLMSFPPAAHPHPHPSPSFASSAKRSGSPSATRTPRTGSLDDVPSYARLGLGNGNEMEMDGGEAEKYGSDPGPAGAVRKDGDMFGVGSVWGERRVWT